jgi:hypothetical protein
MLLLASRPRPADGRLHDPPLAIMPGGPELACHLPCYILPIAGWLAELFGQEAGARATTALQRASCRRGDVTANRSDKKEPQQPNCCAASDVRWSARAAGSVARLGGQFIGADYYTYNVVTIAGIVAAIARRAISAATPHHPAAPIFMRLSGLSANYSLLARPYFIIFGISRLIEEENKAIISTGCFVYSIYSTYF